MAYFLMKDIRKGKTLTLRGEMILDAEIEFENDTPEASAQAKPKPKLPKIRELKWILPPKNSTAYAASKGFAEAGGYETVEHDDFSYPGPRF